MEITIGKWGEALNFAMSSDQAGPVQSIFLFIV